MAGKSSPLVRRYCSNSAYRESDLSFRRIRMKEFVTQPARTTNGSQRDHDREQVGRMFDVAADQQVRRDQVRLQGNEHEKESDRGRQTLLEALVPENGVFDQPEQRIGAVQREVDEGGLSSGDEES